jgi:NAD(P)-dependent dehydrogenase (short-subunit alcohol dehydrogenase family)
LQLEHGYSILKAYGRSKFANVLFTYELARRLEGTGVTVNALHPGLVATNIGSDNGRLVKWAWTTYARLRGALTIGEGARTSIYLASSVEAEGVTGMYFTRQRAVPSDPDTYDQQAALALWEASRQLTGLS